MWQTSEAERGTRLVEERRTKWRTIALSTQPLDVDRAKAAIAHAYRLAGWEPPQGFQFVESPGAEAMRDWRAFNRSKAPSFEGRYWNGAVRRLWKSLPAVKGMFDDIERMSQRIMDALRITLNLPLTHVCGGSFDAGWLCYLDYFQETNRLEGIDATGVLEAAQECGLWLPLAEDCVISAKPTDILLDSSNRLHNPHGAALVYPDAFRVWALHGVAMSERIIDSLDRLSVRSIDKTPNVEHRRALMEYYGEARYLSESGARIVHQDDFGTLYRKEERPEPLVMVKVVNSTPEPDGSYKDYFLRVPPTMTTAREAVAWTFKLDSTAYAPILET